MKLIQINMILIGCIALLGSCTKTHKKSEPYSMLNPKNFQVSINGNATNLYQLKNGDITMFVTNFGARVVSLLVPDRKGEYEDIVLGFSSIDDYLSANEVYHGAIIGRVANRIDKGKFTLDSIEYTLPVNNKTNQLHGGAGGFHNVVWDVRSVNDTSIVFKYTSIDGEMGYPGNLNVEVMYQLSQQNEWIISYKANTDKRTPVMLTSHAFFNLRGEKGGTINDHFLMINADRYIEVNETLIPTGRIPSVEGTVLDFRAPKIIGTDLPKQSEDVQLTNGGGYDHNWPINKQMPEEMGFAGYVYEPESGRKMKLFTEESVLLFYGGNFMDGSDVGKYGNSLKYRESFCLEAQGYPGALNQPDFPSIILGPEDTYQSRTIYEFSVVDRY